MFPGPLAQREAVVELIAERLSAGHAAALEIGTGSMAPWILAGDVVVLAPLAGRSSRRGDVVAWRAGGGRVVVHRVVGKRRRHARRWIVTKGDAVAAADPPVAPEDVLGRVVSVQRGGRSIRAALSGPRAMRQAALSGLEALLAALPAVRWLPALARSSGRSVLRGVRALA